MTASPPNPRRHPEDIRLSMAHLGRMVNPKGRHKVVGRGRGRIPEEASGVGKVKNPPGTSPPNVSWDGDSSIPHWDYDDGKGNRSRWAVDGTQIPADDVHGRTPWDEAPPASEMSIPSLRALAGLAQFFLNRLRPLCRRLLPSGSHFLENVVAIQCWKSARPDRRSFR